ncbi:ABC-type exporter [Candidatus Symbiobacter mobilis CR]|uniref:ABC-type exporter n=2 Tax=Candidatus Symbiobacter TaxID=1436289 RepID=U5N7A2_9BURK|nr:ABC-type exporter [Candidatus Symbiobacter mobilis CR]
MEKQHSVIQCLSAIAQHHGLQVNPERLIEEYALSKEEPRPALVIRMAAAVGLKGKQARLTWKGLFAQTGVFPFIGLLRDGSAVIIVGARAGGEDAENEIAVLDPQAADAKVQYLDQPTFEAQWGGTVLFLKRHHALTDPQQPFSFFWFIPEIMQQKVAFRDIIVAALALTVLSMASPIFFQLVIDKVLVHQSSSTLWVLGVGVLIAIAFESVFGYVRQLLMLAAINKIDMRITRRAFSHLLSLAIDYFDTTSAGVVARVMYQLEGIRGFLTGRLLFTMLDTFSLLIFIPLLFSYSASLSLIVIAFALLMAGIIAGLLPTFKRQLEAQNQAEAARQALLVETIHGMRTVKSLAIEPMQRRMWDQLSANAIQTHYAVSKTAMYGNTATELLGKLLPVIIIVVGAQSVFEQQMTVGALIAFQMFAGRVMGPLVQLASLINEYQSTAVAVRILGEVMNRPSEGRVGVGGLRPTLQGEITFEDVTFRYPGSKVAALDRITFTVRPGTIVGIVGRSGSGKSTLTKIIQGLYSVQEGVVRFDGIDARELELPHMRRQIGVVLQENFLFRGTVRANISIAKPTATFEEIVVAAQTSGADEFIERLPQGYDTLLEENASNLSGGQKQRLSIARALLLQPRILILDEAASALDPESEAIFMSNLSKMAVGRTVLMISHRLSTLVNADTILVMQQGGKIADSGRHEELLARCAPYQQLWHQQTSHL